jgi:hypothetical protein
VRRAGWLIAGAVLVVATGPALGRSATVLSYPVSDVWSSAVRFIRVDRGYVVREKDPASGYILFELGEGGKTYKGSLELVRATDDQGRDATRAAFSLPDLPRHYEGMLLDKLGIKVREERGVPAPAPPAGKPPPDRNRPDAAPAAPTK